MSGHRVREPALVYRAEADLARRATAAETPFDI